MFSAFSNITRQVEEQRQRTAELNRRAMEQARINHERSLNELKRYEQLGPKTVVIKPGFNQTPPPPLVFR